VTHDLDAVLLAGALGLRRTGPVPRQVPPGEYRPPREPGPEEVIWIMVLAVPASDRL
jgi:hypothetical protein